MSLEQDEPRIYHCAGGLEPVTAGSTREEELPSSQKESGERPPPPLTGWHYEDSGNKRGDSTEWVLVEDEPAREA